MLNVTDDHQHFHFYLVSSKHKNEMQLVTLQKILMVRCEIEQNS